MCVLFCVFTRIKTPEEATKYYNNFCHFYLPRPVLELNSKFLLKTSYEVKCGLLFFGLVYPTSQPIK